MDTTEPTTYGKYQYLEAKRFLQDAVVINSGYSSFVDNWAYYKKPDGSIWYEHEKNLEGYEWDYLLILTKR